MSKSLKTLEGALQLFKMRFSSASLLCLFCAAGSVSGFVPAQQSRAFVAPTALCPMKNVLKMSEVATESSEETFE